MDEKIKRTLYSLKANRFNALFADNSETAKKIILSMVQDDDVVGIGDSATLRQIGIIPELEDRKIVTKNPFDRELIRDKSKSTIRRKMQREISTCDVFLVSSNAVTLDGKIVNIDMVGNRVAPMIFGPKKVVAIVSRNKIVGDVKEALYRIKQVIAPYHAKKMGSNTPCSINGICSDCFSDQRICNVTTVLDKKPAFTDFTIIMIDEDLGLGWNENWSQERINGIKTNYYKVRVFGE